MSSPTGVWRLMRFKNIGIRNFDIRASKCLGWFEARVDLKIADAYGDCPKPVRAIANKPREGTQEIFGLRDGLFLFLIRVRAA